MLINAQLVRLLDINRGKNLRDFLVTVYWFFLPLVWYRNRDSFRHLSSVTRYAAASVLRSWTLPFNSSCSANMGVDDLLSCTCTQVIPPTLTTTTMNSPGLAEKLFYDVEGVTRWIIQHYSGGKCVKEQPKIMHTCCVYIQRCNKVLILNEL